MTNKFVVRKEIEFDMGHRIPLHRSKCKNPHGHRYRVLGYVEGYLATEGSDEGMVLDFGDLKDILKTSIHDVYDHGFMIFEGDKDLEWFFFPGSDDQEEVRGGWNVHKVPFIPTAENLSKMFYDIVKEEIQSRGVNGRLLKIEVYETPTSLASYPSTY